MRKALRSLFFIFAAGLLICAPQVLAQEPREPSADEGATSHKRIHLVVTIEDRDPRQKYSLLMYRLSSPGGMQVAAGQQDIVHFLLPEAEAIIGQLHFSEAQEAKLLAAARMDITQLWRQYMNLHRKIDSGSRPPEAVLKAAHELRIRLNQPFAEASLFEKIRRTLLASETIQ
jgi:hypothetical protein